MANINSRFKKNVKATKIEFIFTLNSVLVKADQLNTDYYYACYLIVNGKVTDKRTYQKNLEFTFDLSNIQFSDTISVKYYFLDNISSERTHKTIQLTEKRKQCFFLNAELIKLGSIKYQTLGKNLLENKMLKLGVFPEYLVDIKKDFWEENPFGNRSWQWRLHWFEFISFLISYNYQNKDEASLSLCKELVESWFDKYIGKWTNFEFVWHDHATALRAELLLILTVYLKSYASEWVTHNHEFIERIELFLFESKTRLSDENFYSRHTNHGLEQARVLLLLGIYFDDEGEQYLAVDRLRSELKYSFTEEGVHKENSPGYHQFVLKVFLNIISKFPKNILGDLSEQFEEVGSKALRFLAHIIRPDGYLPIIGDTELIRPTDSYAQYFSEDIEYQEYLYSVTKGRRGIKPKDQYKIYEKSGYAIYRNEWGNRTGFDQILQLILKAGCLTQYHHQQDEGHIVLYAFGEDWLIDSGLYNYINRDLIRQYMRARVAHNVPIIRGAQYSKEFHHRINSWKLNVQKESTLLTISTKNSVMLGVEHQREILINENEQYTFSIEDTLVLQKKEKNDISFYWHIPNDKDITVNESDVHIISRKTNNKMIITFDSIPENIDVMQGIKGNTIRSCVSNSFGVVEDSQCLVVSFASEPYLRKKSTFQFIESAKE